MRNRRQIIAVVVGMLLVSGCGGGGGGGKGPEAPPIAMTPMPPTSTPSTTPTVPPAEVPPTTPTTPPTETPPATPPTTPPLETPPPATSPPGAEVTVFQGGTLDDLKAFSPTLKFDKLAIFGKVTLPVGTATTIEANSLLIGPQGGFEESHTTCEYRAGPDLSLVVKNDATIHGDILLIGRSGDSVTSGAACKSCTGQVGGDVSIVADTIRISSRLENGGGGGASFRLPDVPSLSCSAGASGSIALRANTLMDLTGIRLRSLAGSNFDDEVASSGPSMVSAGGAFTMKSGEINTSGALTFSAASTDIWGAIRYGTLTESIGGAPDTTPPMVAILNQPGTVTSGQVVNLMIQGFDQGLGVREARIDAFGRTTTVDVNAFAESMVTVPLTVRGAASPAAIDVTLIDNKGLSQRARVSGVLITVPAEAEPNNSFGLAQDYTLGAALDGTARITDTGFAYASPPAGFNANANGVFKVEDIYKVVCCDRLASGRPGIDVSLDYTRDASLRADLDMYLFNADGTSVVASAIADNVALNRWTERLTATLSLNDQGKVFYLAIQANNSTTSAVRYRLGP